MSGISRRRRPSQQAIPPADVTDILLWRLAVDVATTHQPRANGTCDNLHCVKRVDGPCEAFRQAQRALRSARAMTPPATEDPVPAPEQPEEPARIRDRFMDWFTPSRPVAVRAHAAPPRPWWSRSARRAA